MCLSLPTGYGLPSSFTTHYMSSDRVGGAGIATMEANLSHQLVGLCHEPLFQVLLNVRKPYHSLYRGRCMEILRGYGLGPNIYMLLHHL